MPAFLTFAMVAPIASFGSLAVGERRPSWDRPARSAILGLIGASLGVEREDDDGQASLSNDYGIAVLCHSAGRPLADYHTAQVPPTRRGRRFATRRAELASHDLSTILSRRDYRVGAWHLGAVWVRGDTAPWKLDDIETAMRSPAFIPYLGRKNCPLGLPLAPAITQASDPRVALMARSVEGPESRFRSQLAEAPGEVIIARDEWSGSYDSEVHMRRRELRRDQPGSRRLWQFDLRSEVIESVGCDEEPA